MPDRALAVVHANSPRFRARLAAAEAVVARALARARKPYVAFSGGKDSLATAVVVLGQSPDCLLHWSDDELEYPEAVEMMTVWQSLAGPQLRITKGVARHAGWFDPWKDRPFWRDPLPGTRRVTLESHEYMANQGHDLVFTGLRMAENYRVAAQLEKAVAEQGDPTYPAWGGLRCCPLWDWSSDDVWALILCVGTNGVPYNRAYDVLDRIHVPEPSQRTGPLPLTPRQHLADGWPDLLARLEARYGPRWGR